jgi:hypothetical protein
MILPRWGEQDGRKKKRQPVRFGSIAFSFTNRALNFCDIHRLRAFVPLLNVK